MATIYPDGPQARAYREIAKAVWMQLSGGAQARAAPRIVIE